MTPRVSFAIPHWNRADLLRASIARLQHLYKDIDFDVSICDDGSKESQNPALLGIPSVLTKFHGFPPHEHPRNPAQSINRAVSQCSSEIVCLMNPEIWHLSPHLFEVLALLDPQDDVSYFVSPIVHLDADATSRLLENDDVPMILKKGGLEIDDLKIERSSSYDGLDNVRWTSSSRSETEKPYHNCVFFTKKLWERLGGFDEGYMEGIGWEDEDWLERVQASSDIRWLNGLSFHLFHGELYLGEREQELQKKNRAIYETKYGRLPVA